MQFYCHDFDQNRPPQMISLGFSNLELIFTVSSCIPTWILISSLSSRCLWFHSLSWGSLSNLCVSSVHDLGLATTCWTCYHWFSTELEKTADIWRRNRCMVSPRNAVWGTSTEISHWWRVTILSWAVLPIGWKFASTYQKRALPSSG